MLVVVSAVVVGLVVHWLVPDVPLAAGIALGAIVSPTDAVATSIVRRAGVSPRIVTVLEGESMLNDASALVLLRAAIAGLGVTVTVWEVAGQFLWSVVVAAAVGLVVGRLTLLVRSWIRQSAAGVAVSFVVPFVAYLPAEALEASGLVAAVVAGLVSGHGAPRALSAEDRITERVVWATIELLLESAVFLLMGLQLYGLVQDLAAEGESLLGAAGLGGIAALLVVVLRAAFVAPAVWSLARRARRNPAARERLTGFQEQLAHGELPQRPARRGDPEKRARWTENRLRRIASTLTQRIADIDYLTAEKFGPREAVVLVWAGMRGAVTLAAAQSLPPDAPHRSLLVVAAFVVAGGTVLVQGATLPWVVRRLRLGASADDAGEAAEHGSLRAELLQSALARLDRDDLRRPDGTPYSERTLARIRELGLLPRREGDEEATAAVAAELRSLRLEMISAERAALLRIRDVGTYRSSVLNDALVQLDAAEIGLRLREGGRE